MSADSLTHGGWIVEKALQRFQSEKWIQRIEGESGDIIRVIPEYRLTMEYYKNGLILSMMGKKENNNIPETKLSVW